MFQVSIALELKSLFGYKCFRPKRGWWHLFNFRCLEYILKIMKSKCMTKLENNFICDKEVFKIRANISPKQSFERPIKPLVIVPWLFPVGLHGEENSPFLCVWIRRYYVILYPFFSPFSGCAHCSALPALERPCVGEWGPFTGKPRWWSKGLISQTLKGHLSAVT